MFSDILNNYNFNESVTKVLSKKYKDVESALGKSISGVKLDFEDYLALVSPFAEEYLEEMAVLSQNITRMRFGKTIQIYMPLYLSNECRSSCLYCGFSFENKIPRKTLSFDELRKEAEAISKKGVRHVLILTGEDYAKTPLQYISESIKLLKTYFDSVSIEIYPMEKEDYSELIKFGADTLALYQETYDPEAYKKYHVRGVKKDMKYRLDAPDRGGEAGFRKIGIGALFGLSNPYGEMHQLALHGNYILKNYWRTELSISLPRMKQAEGDFNQIIPVSDKEFVRFIFALRIYFPDAGLVLSTRENAKLRDRLMTLGITTMSAESRTDPGGYSLGKELKQFETEDRRTVSEVVAIIREKGYDPIFKNFDRAIQ